MIYAIFLQFTHFVAKYVLSQFTHLCGDKFSKKSRLWRKMTNMRYAPHGPHPKKRRRKEEVEEKKKSMTIFCIFSSPFPTGHEILGQLD